MVSCEEKSVKKQKEVVEKKSVGVNWFEAFTVLQGELRGSKSNPQRRDTTEKRPGPDLLSENELTSHIYN
jgi:hypothetical protein